MKWFQSVTGMRFKEITISSGWMPAASAGEPGVTRPSTQGMASVTPVMKVSLSSGLLVCRAMVHKCTAFYGEFTLELISSEQGFYLYFVPGFNGISVHCYDAIGRTKAGFVSGRFRSYGANQGRCFRMISECDKKAKK